MFQRKQNFVVYSQIYTEFYEELSLTKQHSLSFSLSSFFVITWYAPVMAVVLSQTATIWLLSWTNGRTCIFQGMLVGGQGGELILLCSIFLYLLHFEIDTELLLGGVISFIDLEVCWMIEIVIWVPPLGA